MSIFMDRHDITGLTAKHVAEVHQADIKVQDQYGCKALTYWFNEKSGLAFCLIDAPEKNAVIEMHKNAHGAIPHKVIEVNSNLVEAFLGRITDPVFPVDPAEPDLVINESGVRTIMYIEFRMEELIGKRKNSKRFNVYNEFIHQIMEAQDCRKIKDIDDGYIASFTSEENAIKCAIDILKKLKDHIKQNPNIGVRASIGISIGMPVTEREGLFGETIMQAKNLSYIAGDGQIIISSKISDVRTDNKLVKSLTPDEEKFLYRLMEITDKNWNQADFRVDDYCNLIGVSKSQLYRKTTALTRRSPNQFIREFRLRKALGLIEKRKGNITEIALESGFGNPSYFTQCFHKRFGLLPSEYEAYVT
jgi:AraC-like DNA-binding protein